MSNDVFQESLHDAVISICTSGCKVKFLAFFPSMFCLCAFQMGVAAVVHLYVFPAVPYKRGERCVRNVAVLSNYASLGTPPDPEEVQDCERSTRVRVPLHDEREKRLKFHQSVRDVVVGSGGIVS